MNSCSHERLELAVAGLLNADDELALSVHLDDCELCSAEIERLSGGERARNEVATMLRPNDLDDAFPLPECSTADFVVEHLEPSDDPTVLGRLGSYDVLDVIGRGGMGLVLKGFDRELKRFVAIKALAPHLAHSALARKRFAREAQAAAAVVNLHVIAIHQVQPNGPLPYLVMPLLNGESLAQRVKARGTLELQEILRIGMQAAEGLAAAHGQGLVHRDIKPANILLEKGVDRAVLTDFGLARAADDVSMTRWGIIAGTPEYMSPEQARGEALDSRSDQFSLGCVLYEMATGVSPFRADSTMATLRRIIDDKPIAMASHAPELPPWFIGIVERLLSKDPAQRFGSAGEVSALLEQCLSHLQQPAAVPLPTSFVRQGSNRRSIFTANRKAVIVTLGVIGFALLAMVLFQVSEAPDIAGQWTSEEWGTVKLEAKQPGRYQGSITGSHKSQSGTVNLKWSRVERRFNGTWETGSDRSGKMSLRLVDNEIRGGWTTDKGAQRDFGTPRLADLLWTRSREITGQTVKPPTSVNSNDALAAEKAFQQLQQAERDVNEAFDRELSKAKHGSERERVERDWEEQDPRQTFTPKYLALEEKYRGTAAALKALNQVIHFARSVGDPACAAAQGRIEAVDRLMNHYLRHEGIEKTFDDLSGGPEVPRHYEFLQAVLENNSSRHVQAEALVAQLRWTRNILEMHMSASIVADLLAQSPLESSRTAFFESWLRRAKSIDAEKLRAEANEKIERLKEFQQEPVAVYGSASKAARHLAHGINRVLVGQPAPEITATTTTGKSFQLSKLRGNTVVLVFAHNEVNRSGNDLMYAPLRKLAAEYKDSRVEVVMILTNRDDQNQSAAALKRDLPWTVIPQSSNGPIILDWGIEGAPTVYIIDSEGILHPELHMPVYHDDSGYDVQDVAEALDHLLNDGDATAKVSGTDRREPVATNVASQFPGMTESIAAAILDWVDDDNDQRPFGAEAEAYQQMDSPYTPSNRPFKEFDELLCIRGVTPELLYGADTNRNGIIDGGEDNSSDYALGWAGLIRNHHSQPTVRQATMLSDVDRALFTLAPDNSRIDQFAELDTDCDGKLSLAEFGIGRKPSYAAKWFGLRDADHDGVLCLAEFAPQSALSLADMQPAQPSDKTGIPPQQKSIDRMNARMVQSNRGRSVSNIKQILLAMQRYHADHRRFPPAVIHGKDGQGKVPHSWRVELLPYLENGESLYREYQFDEPWDSAANRRVLAQMPDVYRHASAQPKSTHSAYYVVVGADAEDISKEESGPTTFSRKVGMSLREILDGASYTIAVVETNLVVPWTKPDDVLYDPEQGTPALGGYYEGGRDQEGNYDDRFYVGTFAGSVHFLPANISQDLLRAYLSPAGREKVPPLENDSSADAGEIQFVKHSLKNIKALTAAHLLVQELSKLGQAGSVEIVADERTNSIIAWGNSAAQKLVVEQLSVMEALADAADKVPAPAGPLQGEEVTYWSDRSEDQWVTGMKIVHRPTSSKRKLIVEFVLRNDASETRQVELDLYCGTKSSLSIREGNQVDVDFKETRHHQRMMAAGQVTTFEEGRAEISFEGLESGDYTLRFYPVIYLKSGAESQRGVPFDLRLPVHFDTAYDSLPIHWGKPLAGLRIGAMFRDARKGEMQTFNGRDRAAAQIFIQNVSQKEIDCGFDPPYHSWGMRVTDSTKRQVEPVTDESNIINRIGIRVPRPTLWASLAPGEIQPLKDSPKFRLAAENEGLTTNVEDAQFSIVPANDSGEAVPMILPVAEYIYILSPGLYLARAGVTLRKRDSPEASFSVESGPIPFCYTDTAAVAAVEEIKTQYDIP